MVFKIAQDGLTLPRRFSEPKQPGERLSELRAVVLLAGSVRADPLRKSTGRNIFELPVATHFTVLDCWRQQLMAMASHFGVDPLAVRIIVDRHVPMNMAKGKDSGIEISVEQDPSEFRGTAGLLSDLARDYGDNDYMLVVRASQILIEPLADLARLLVHAHADVSLMCLDDGSPVGLSLVRCGCLRQINTVGFVDFNEQALPSIAKNGHVQVVRYSQAVGMPIRTVNNYLDALRAYHRFASGRFGDAMDGREEWYATFGIIEPGAAVHPDAVVHDSVVLGGARVEHDAILVRSVICPGAVIRSGQCVIDSLVASGGSGYRGGNKR